MTRTKIPVRFTGQHFTIDRDLIQKAIKFADLKPHDTVLDIGAGKGFITVHLIHHAREIIAVEKDRELVRHLKYKFTKCPKVAVCHTDFLDFRLPVHPFKVVSNIPFGITAEILRKLLLENQRYFLGGTIIMSRDTARKLISPRIFNPLVAYYRTFYSIRLLQEIGPESFIPPPTVTSALVSFERRQIITEDFTPSGYLHFLNFVLENPGVSMRQVLKKILRKTQIRACCQRFGLNAETLVEDAHPLSWKIFYEEMKKSVPSRYWP